MTTPLWTLSALPPLADGHFRRLQTLARERWALDLRDERRELIEGRLQMWAQRNPDLDVGGQLLRVLGGSATPLEDLELFEELAVTHTAFHREPVHFQCLVDEVVAARQRGGERRLRVWSAGCSIGCEPYTLAMTLREQVRGLDAWDVRILATDLSVSALRKARSGLYEWRDVEHLPAALLRQHFVELPNGQFRVAAAVRQLVTFKLLNLVDPWPMHGPFDAIFCRNVFLYQPRDRAFAAVQRFERLLVPGGLLVLGCAEMLPGVHPGLQRVGPSVFCRVEAS